MDDLVAFLAARIDEDEAGAKAAQPGPWTLEEWTGGFGPVASVMMPLGNHEGATTGLTSYVPLGTQDADTAAHIARHDPERVLREVAADRAILAEHAMAERAYRQARDEHARDLTPGRADTQLASSVALDKLMVWERALRHRAAVYSDRPDYRAGWKP